MGCLKLPYREKEDLNFFQGLWKKSDGPENCDNYYPYGLSTANSWTRENATGNNFLFNGGTELNTTTSVYDLHYRNYDPVLGRMNQVDPLAWRYAGATPYNYAFNSPTNLNDPLGDDPNDPKQKPKPTGAGGLANGGCSWCSPQDTGTAGGGPFAGLMGRSAGFFNPGWQPGSGSLSAGAFAAHDQMYQDSRIMASLRAMFPDASFSSGGSGNGFWIKMFAVDWSSGSTDGDVITMPSCMLRNVMVSGISLDHFKTMTNPIVQAIHQGQRDFVNNPWGGALIGFLSTAPLGGAGAWFGRALFGGSRALAPVAIRGMNATVQLGRTGLNVMKSNLIQTGARNVFVNGVGQLVFSGGNIGEIDKADLAISAVSGNSFVFSALSSAVIDWKSEGLNTDKSSYQVGVELGTGLGFGFFGGVTGTSLGQTGTGLMVESTLSIYNGLFNWTLLTSPH